MRGIWNSLQKVSFYHLDMSFEEKRNFYLAGGRKSKDKSPPKMLKKCYKYM